jgi:hypothetical protein
MRPSSVDTSEPACVKRKMLSTNSSTSWFCTSRKYSAIVSADRATRRRTPGGSSIWPKTRAAFSMTPDSSISSEEVVALTGALADAGEHRHATVLLGDAVDHLLDEHGLADAGAAEQADLAALDVRREQVDDLDAGLEHLGLRLELVEGRRRRWISQRSLTSSSSRPRTSSGSPITLNTWPSTASPTGTVMPCPGSRHRGAADQAVGRLQADGADAAVADVLGDLEGQRRGLALDRERHLERVVDLGHRVGGNSTSTTGPTGCTS